MANIFQPFDFKDVDDFLESLPEEEIEIVKILRSTIIECLPNCREKLSYNVPFYSLNKRICYIWPASVPWGKVQSRGVQIGFCQAYLMRDELNYLEKGRRKQVFTKTFFKKTEIDLDLLRTYLYEALEVDTNFS